MYWLTVLFERQQAASPAPQCHLLDEIRQCGYRCEVTKLMGTLKIVPGGLESVPKAVGGTYLFHGRQRIFSFVPHTTDPSLPDTPKPDSEKWQRTSTHCS